MSLEVYISCRWSDLNSMLFLLYGELSTQKLLGWVIKKFDT